MGKFFGDILNSTPLRRNLWSVSLRAWERERERGEAGIEELFSLFIHTTQGLWGIFLVIHTSALFLPSITINIPTNAACELDILGHDGDSLSVNGTPVGFFKDSHEVRLRGFLECGNSRGLKALVIGDILGNLADEAGKGELADQELSALLVVTNLTECDGARAEAWLFHGARGRGGAVLGLSIVLLGHGALRGTRSGLNIIRFPMLKRLFGKLGGGVTKERLHEARL
jgi:hypothetical protein